jgi:hypothetical protein
MYEKQLAIFIKERTGKRVDFDWGAFWYQCNDLTRKRLQVIWLPQYKPLGDNGVKYIAQYPSKYLVEPLKWVKNTPLWVPKPWDIVILSQPTATGHIAVVVRADINSVRIFEQNGGKWSWTWLWVDACRERTLTYKTVLGWIDAQAIDPTELEAVKQVMSANSKLHDTTKDESVKDKTHEDNTYRRWYYWIK